MLLSTDVLLEVLAFLNVQAIFAGCGLNTASRLLSKLIPQHHPAIKRLFAKGDRVIGGKLKIGEPISETDCWHACISDEKGDYKPWRWLGKSPSRDLPLPVPPATQEILGLGNVSLILHRCTQLYNQEV
jgi:hypothetical protein